MMIYMQLIAAENLINYQKVKKLTKFSLIQLNTGCDPKKSFEVLKKYITKAAKSGSKFVCTPETTNIMEVRNSELFKKIYTEKEDIYLEKILGLAKDLKIWINLGSWILKDKKNKAVNRTILINPDGLIHARYDKIHLFDVEISEKEKYLESKTYISGNKAVVTKTPFGSLGLSICYDLRFPYLYRDLARNGAEIIFVPSAFTYETGKVHWHSLLKARAIETGSYIIAPAQEGIHENKRRTYGHSLVIDPWGKIIAEKKRGIGVMDFNIDLKRVKNARSKIPSILANNKYKISSN